MAHYKARLYSPTLGRFLQTDPVGYKDQVNLYEYVGDDPVDGVDPSGMVEANTCSRVGSTACAGSYGVTATDGVDQSKKPKLHPKSPGYLDPGKIEEDHITETLVTLGIGLSRSLLNAGWESLESLLSTETAESATGTVAVRGGEKSVSSLYQKLDAAGNHLKFGVTKSPATRYTRPWTHNGAVVS